MTSDGDEYFREKQSRKGEHGKLESMVEILNEEVREDHPRQLRLEQRSTGIEGLSHEDMHRGVFADVECCKEKASEEEL